MALNYPANVQWPDILQRLGAWGGLGDPAREADAQAIIDAYTVAEAKAWLKTQVADRARDVQDAFIAARCYSVGEAASWPVKLSQARAYQASGKPTDAPMLQAESAASGRTLADVASRVLNNGDAFSAFTAQCAGNRQKHQDAIDALTTFEQVATYDYSTGWPG